MSWSKTVASYSTARDRWSCHVRGDIEARGKAVTTSQQRGKNKHGGGIHTLNMLCMVVTELVSQLPMSRSKAGRFYSEGRMVERSER